MIIVIIIIIITITIIIVIVITKINNVTHKSRKIIVNGSRYSRMDQVKFVEDSL